MSKLAKLRGRIYEKYGTVGAFADTIGVSRATVYNVLNGRIEPRPIVKKGWCFALDISEDEEEIFFYPEKSEN